MACWHGFMPACAEASQKFPRRCKNVLTYIPLSFGLETLRPSSLELGAGGGLVGLGIARGCEVDHSIYITDQENMLSLMEKNIALNGLKSRVVPLILDW